MYGPSASGNPIRSSIRASGWAEVTSTAKSIDSPYVASAVDSPNVMSAASATGAPTSAARRATTATSVAAARRVPRGRGHAQRAHASPARRRMPRPFWVAPSSPSRTSVYEVPYETGTAGASSRTISSARA